MPANLGSQDLSRIATTIDGLDWAVKSLDDAPLLPISEYLGYRLGEAAQLAVPYWHVLRMPEEDLAFGSRFEGGVSEWKTMIVEEQNAAISDAASSICRILAFDLFYANVDRHAGNLLYRRNRSNQWTVYAFDFSRAGMLNGFPMLADLPMDADANTPVFIAWLRQQGLWDAKAAGLTIASLQAVDVASVDQMIADAPDSWLDTKRRADLLNWWGSPNRNARLRKVLSLL